MEYETDTGLEIVNHDCKIERYSCWGGWGREKESKKKRDSLRKKDKVRVKKKRLL